MRFLFPLTVYAVIIDMLKITRSAALVFLMASEPVFFFPGNAFAYGIDDLVGPEWRIGIFSFLVFGMMLYAFAVVLYMRRGRGAMKKGEYVLLSIILLGVGLGLVVSFIQLLQGFLL